MTSRFSYPDAKQVPISEVKFGRRVDDPYRWLEDDVSEAAEVAAWVTAQNELTDDYLAALPGRDVFRDRLKALFDYERVSPPFPCGGRYFYTRHSGLQNQPILVVREGFDGPERVLIDPNAWSDDGTIALAEWRASDDGRHVAYAVQDGGADWRTIKVLDVNSSIDLSDEVERVRFTTICWTKEREGFFYSRYPDRDDGASSHAGLTNHAIYFHLLGTPQSQDRLVYATPDQPHLLNMGLVSEDGRYLFIISSPGPGANALAIVDLKAGEWKPRKLVESLDAEWLPYGNVGTKIFVATSKDAERKKIVSLDLAKTAPMFEDVVSEQAAVLSDGAVLGERIIACYLVDAKTEVRRYRLDGTPDGVVELPGIGTAGGFRGDPKGREAFYVFTSFNYPTTVFRYDVMENTSYVWAAPETRIDLNRIAVDQHFYASKDGTRIPMFVIRRKDATQPAPTMLHAYGGFGISTVPVYSSRELAWVDQGGIVAFANIRGGGEYGQAWHDAGRLQKKQNSFDDFISAGEFLKQTGIASPGGLVIQGESNGGLLVGAVVNQRPDLFDAALPGVGVMDMLRFHLFTGGRLWMEDFGDPDREPDFGNLLRYSPYHTIASGKDYPAILATTADRDDRVVPGHTFKYIAAIQASDVGNKPQLVRVDARAGHGAGKPMDKFIEETADRWAFAAHWTGLRPCDME